jgi:hypothetical protein
MPVMVMALWTTRQNLRMVCETLGRNVEPYSEGGDLRAQVGQAQKLLQVRIAHRQVLRQLVSQSRCRRLQTEK